MYLFTPTALNHSMVHMYTTNGRKLNCYLQSVNNNPAMDVYMDIVLGLIYIGDSSIPINLMENEKLPVDKKEILAEKILLAGSDRDQLKQDMIQQHLKRNMIKQLKNEMVRKKNTSDMDVRFERIVDGNIELLQGARNVNPELQEWLEQYETIKMSQDPLQILQIDDYPEYELTEDEFEKMAKLVVEKGRELSSKFHPVNGGTVEVQQKINKAVEIFSNYDKYLEYENNDDPSRSIFTFSEIPQTLSETENAVTKTPQTMPESSTVLTRVLNKHSHEILAKTKAGPVKSAVEFAKEFIDSGSAAIMSLKEYIRLNAPRVKKKGIVAKSSAGVPTCTSYKTMSRFTSGSPPMFTGENIQFEEKEDDEQIQSFEDQINDFMYKLNVIANDVENS